MTINCVFHKPVLLNETLEGLSIKQDGIYLDCTLGGGGHFKQIVNMLNEEGVAVGIDRDSTAIGWVKKNLGKAKPRIIIEQEMFSNFNKVLSKNSISGVDGILLDLGVSSQQIDNVKRGFSYKSHAKLDMRMNMQDNTTAEDIIANSSKEQLIKILHEYGEIRNPERMAAVIYRFSKTHRIVTSTDLKTCLENEYGTPIKFKILSKVFQALRIAVNNELEELQNCLIKAVEYLNKGGRLVVIAYHSLEDRIVKNFIRDKESLGGNQNFLQTNKNYNRHQILKRINKKIYRPSNVEIKNNSRARSARLRIAEKVI